MKHDMWIEVNMVIISHCNHLKNEFNFWNVHGVMYTFGLLQSSGEGLHSG